MGNSACLERPDRDGMERLDAVGLRGMVAAGESALAHNVEAVNALNVFPVPDGDTGTNMLLTLRAVGEELAKSDASDLAGVAASGARGALLGARGNSGVILSSSSPDWAAPFETPRRRTYPTWPRPSRTAPRPPTRP